MKTTLLILTIIIYTSKLFSQTLNADKTESELWNSYKKILYYRLGTETIYFDSIEIENQNFRKKINLNICNNPNSINYNFDSLKQNIHIVNSEDGKLRIYSWNTWLGGTMEDYESVFQFKYKDSVYSTRNQVVLEEKDENYLGFYSQIFTLKTENKIYYLTIENGKYSSKDISQSVKIMSIENNILNDSIKLFKTSDGVVNSLNIYFDFFSVVNRPERPLQLIKYDKKKNILFIPIINEKEQVTNRYDLYQFTGENFEHIGTKWKNKRWYPRN
jgi:hypothetical protein